MFFGECVGVILHPEQINSKKLRMTFISGNDGYWSEMVITFSIYWLDEYMQLLTEACEWCEKNCVRIDDCWELK